MPLPAPRGRILVVDDERAIRRYLNILGSRAGYDVLEAVDGTHALAAIRAGTVDVVLMDIHMPGMDGMAALKETHRVDAAIPVILMTGHGTIGAAVEAVKCGAYDYLVKPLNNDDLLLTLGRAFESCRLRTENQRLRARLDDDHALRHSMGSSDRIALLQAAVQRVAPTEFTVVITGETGAGKEVVAQALHRASARATGPFVSIDCGAIQPTLIESELFGHEQGAFTSADRTRPGKFEAARGGTLFLDEVQNLPVEVQTKFLRVLEQRTVSRVGGTALIAVDVRVLAATNQDLHDLVAAGRFRVDLFHRLNQFAIKIPPLRDRAEDILFLAKRFLDQAGVELGKTDVTLSAVALDALQAYSWPGNVRELRNVIRRAVLLADGSIQPEHLKLEPMATPIGSSHATTMSPLDGSRSMQELVQERLDEYECQLLHQALNQCGGNKAKAARLLRIDYTTLFRKLRREKRSNRSL